MLRYSTHHNNSMAASSEADIITVLRNIKRWYIGGAEGTKKVMLTSDKRVTYQLSVWTTAEGLVSLNMKDPATKKSEFSLTKRGLTDEDYQYIGGCIMEVLDLPAGDTAADEPAPYYGEVSK